MARANIKNAENLTSSMICIGSTTTDSIISPFLDHVIIDDHNLILDFSANTLALQSQDHNPTTVGKFLCVPAIISLRGLRDLQCSFCHLLMSVRVHMQLWLIELPMCVYSAGINRVMYIWFCSSSKDLVPPPLNDQRRECGVYPHGKFSRLVETKLRSTDMKCQRCKSLSYEFY